MNDDDSLPLVLLIDDTVCEDSGQGFDKSDFLSVVGSDVAVFEFCTAKDDYEGTYTSMEAIDFVERVIRAQGRNPSVVFVDIMFGRLEDAKELGFEIIIKIHDKWPEIPIIAMSSEQPEAVLSGSNMPLLKRAKARGASAFLKKPFSKAAFTSALGMALAARAPVSPGSR